MLDGYGTAGPVKYGRVFLVLYTGQVTFCNVHTKKNQPGLTSHPVDRWWNKNLTIYHTTGNYATDLINWQEFKVKFKILVFICEIFNLWIKS